MGIMEDSRKTKAELQAEVARLRAQVEKLQEREAARLSAHSATLTTKDYAETLIASSLDAILSVDLDSKIVGFNAAAETAFGYQSTEVLGRSVDLLYEEKTTGRAVLARVLDEGQFTGEVSYRRKNATLFWGYLCASPVRNAESQLVGFMGIVRDISERKQEERERAQFLAMLAHDIKKPLGAILACAEMVQDGVKAYGLMEEEDLLDRLRGSVTTIDSLVTNYLDFSRIEAGLLALVLGPLPVARLLQRLRRQYSAEARRRRLQLDVASAPDSLVLEGDMLALERVLVNLVHNALKFTPAGGTIRVHAERQGDMAVITVKDTGPGIAAEDRSFLFEKYHHPTPSRQHEGTGLGLVIVKALVEAHRGRVEVDSRPGHGACFTLYLPLWKESRENTSDTSNTTVVLGGASSFRHESH